MEERIALPQFFRTGFRAQIAICAIGPLAFEAGAQVKGADIVAAATVGTGFFRVGELHEACLIRLQQHLDECIRTPFLAEVFLIVHEQPQEACHQRNGYSDEWKIAG